MWPFNRKKKNESIRQVQASNAPRSEEDFGTSMAVAMATDNALLGYAAGGSLVGAMLGESMVEDSAPGCDSGSSSDYGSSSDSGSSYDSSSSCDSGGGSSD